MKRGNNTSQGQSFDSLLASHKTAKRRRKRRKLGAKNGEVVEDSQKVMAMNKPSVEELRLAAETAEGNYKSHDPTRNCSPNNSVKNVPREVRKMLPISTSGGQRAWLSDDWLKSLDPPSCGMGNKFFLYTMYRLYAKFNRKRLCFFSTEWLREKFHLLREVRYDIKDIQEKMDGSQVNKDSDMLQSVFKNCTMFLQWSPAILIHSRLVYEWFSTFMEECVNISQAKYPDIDFENHLIIHLRTGDIFDERVRRSENKSSTGFIFYTQPPAWFYGWLARKNSYKMVSIVTQTPESTYCQAVTEAVKAVSSVTSVELRSGKMLEDFGLLMRAQHFVSSISTFSWWAMFLGNKYFSNNCEMVGDTKCGHVRRQVFVPLTGYWHPESKHGAQCKFILDNASNHGCCDRYEYVLEKQDCWQNTNEQRSKLFEFNAPTWFLDRYGI